MATEFDGIREKLKRADQNIRNLKTEIDLFVSQGQYPVMPKHDDKAWQEAVNYHRDKVIPLRLSVLAGEIVHQLRSALDHIVWIFSDSATRLNHPNAIEFPVFESRPLDKGELRRYQRKVQGITNNQVLKFISALQPYHAGADAPNQPVCIIHNMDRFDKHRELMIVNSAVNLTFTFPSNMTELRRLLMEQQQGKVFSPREKAMIGRAIKQYGSAAPDVAFGQFGKRGSQLVVPMLEQLSYHVRMLVDKFEAMYK